MCVWNANERPISGLFWVWNRLFSEIAFDRTQAVMNAKEIVLDYGDYFTILLKRISGIFVNNLPLSS